MLKGLWRFAPVSLGTGHYIFAAVLLVRLYGLVHLTNSPLLLPSQGDMHFYNEWAQRIVQGRFTDHLAFYGLPLYAYLLAAIYGLGGYNPFAPGFLQACLDAGTAVLIYQIAIRIFGSQGARRLSPPLLISDNAAPVIGVCAASGWAFFLPAQAYSVILMPTAWLVFVFWFIVWQIVKANTALGARRCLLLGLLIGVTAMGIATILFAVPLLVAAILIRPKTRQADSLHGGGRESWKLALPGKLAALATLVIGVLAGTSPAWLHNRFVADDAVFLSAHSGVNFWIGNNPAANGYPRIPPGLRAGQQAMLTDSIRGAEAAAGRPLKRSEVSAFWSAKATSYIAENPAAWVRLLLVKITNFWNAFQYDDLSIITNLREGGVVLPGFRFGIVAALALPGMVLAAFSNPASRWVLAAVFLHMASLLGVFVTERYRLAAVPGLLLFAAFGLYTFWWAIATMRFGRVGLYSVLLALAVCFVSVRRGDAELWALDPYNSGLYGLETHQLRAAEEKLTLAYAYVPQNAEVNFALGNLQLARGDVAGARIWYERTLALNPRHEGSFNNLGVLALQEGDAKSATKFFENALAIEPADAKTHYLLARAALAAGDAARALAEVEIALRLNPRQVQFNELRQEILAR